MQAGRPYSPCTLCGTTSSTILLACSCLWSDTAPLAAARPLSPLEQPAAAAATAAVSWGMGCSSKVGGWAFCGRTPCLLVWLRRRTLDEAPSGRAEQGCVGGNIGTRFVCWGSETLIDLGKIQRDSLPSVSAIGDKFSNCANFARKQKLNKSFNTTRRGRNF